MAIQTTSNAIDFPDALISGAHLRSQAIYCDVNPVPDPNLPELLYDAAAVMGSLRNLLLCPRGGRSRIFQPDYFCGVFGLLQEPFDSVTANLLQIDLYQSLSRWEPRIRLSPRDVVVLPDISIPGYSIQITVNVNGSKTLAKFDVPVQ
jgi:phage baseplate assembly protein W